VAVAVVLFLPDGHAMLDFVDDAAAGKKSCVSMGRAHPYPNGELTEREIANTVCTCGVPHAKSLHG